MCCWVSPLGLWPFSTWGQGNLSSWTNQQAPHPLAQLPAGFIQWERTVGDARRTGSGIWLPPPSWLRFSAYSHSSWEPGAVSFLVYNPVGVIEPFTTARPKGFTAPVIPLHLSQFCKHVVCVCACVLRRSVVSDSATPWTVAARLLCPWDSPG